MEAGEQTQGLRGIGIGYFAGNRNQGTRGIAIGDNAALEGQGAYSIAIGDNAAYQTQGTYSIAIGSFAGFTGQSSNSIAIGYYAGRFSQGTGAVAIGWQAGASGQASGAVAIGWQAGYSAQSTGAIAIGYNAGYTAQGNYSIAIGQGAGQTGQAANSIILNASGVPLNSATTGLFVNPIRNSGATQGSGVALVYNTTSREISYGTKTFVIDNPQDRDKYLVHACLEGPEAGVYYRGKGLIPETEKYTEIILPKYVKHISTEFTVQITAINDNNIFYTSEVDEEHGTFRVFGNPGSFFWHVYGKRQTIEVEPLKAQVNLKGSGPYMWVDDSSSTNNIISSNQSITDLINDMQRRLNILESRQLK